MRRLRSSDRHVLALASALSLGVAACAPDLTIGAATTTTGQGGTAVTTTGGTGGTGGTAGSGGVARGSVQWAVEDNSTGDEHVMGAATGNGGEVFIAVETLDATGTPVVESMSLSIFEDGIAFGADYIGGYGPHRPNAIAADEEDTFMAGDLLGSTSFGDPDPEYPASAGGSDCLVARVTPGIAWIRSIGTKAYSSCAGVAVTSEGVFVAGTFSATLDATLLDAAKIPVVSAGGDDLFVARFSRDGKPQVAWRFGDTHDQRLRAMGSDAAGNLYVLADDPGPKGKGGTDILLLKLGPDGALIEERRYGNVGDESALALAVAADGTTAIAGTLLGSLDLGGDVLGGDAFVAVFDPAGQHVWSHGIAGDASNFSIRTLLFDQDRRLYMGGDFSYELHFAGKDLAAVGGYDAFVAAFDPSGALAWVDKFGNNQDQTIAGLTFAADGTLLAAGHFQGDLDVVARVLGPADGSDVFVLGIAP